MANTFNNLTKNVYRALNVISKEPKGLTRAVVKNVGQIDAISTLGQTVRVPIVDKVEVTDYTPSSTNVGPVVSNRTTDNVEITITKSRNVNWALSGEESRLLMNADAIEGNVFQQSLENAINDIANEVEADLFLETLSSSRAVGTAGSVPFGTANNLMESANIKRELSRNGAPMADRRLVLTDGALANLNGLQTSLFHVNESGTTETLREGIVGRLHGFQIYESLIPTEHTKGTGTGYITNLGATLPIGSTTIAVDTGSGTILAGDVVTFAGDSNKYIVATALASGSFTIAGPGLRQTLADGVAMTIGDNYDIGGVGFTPNSIVLATRAPFQPEGGDSAFADEMIIDPMTGLSMRVAMYKTFGSMSVSVQAAWGFKMIKPEHSIILLS